MARLVPRDTICGTPDDLDLGRRALDDELRQSWEDKWKLGHELVPGYQHCHFSACRRSFPAGQIGLSVCELPMAAVMDSALRVKGTREPGDRIIVANAMANNDAPLVTSDRRIHEHYPSAIWQQTQKKADSGNPESASVLNPSARV